MMLRASTDLQAAPDAVLRFFDEMADNYLAWHPDHVLFRWEQGWHPEQGLAVGVVFYFEEYIADKLLKKRVRITRFEPGRWLEFAPTFWLLRLFLPAIRFRVEPLPAGCRVVQELQLRMGPLAAWLHRRELAAVREHMRLEGENLGRILAGGPAERDRLRRENRWVPVELTTRPRA